MVTIIDDDQPGEVEFSQQVHLVKESIGEYVVKVERSKGCDGKVSVNYKVIQMSAINGRDFDRIFLIVSNLLQS